MISIAKGLKRHAFGIKDLYSLMAWPNMGSCGFHKIEEKIEKELEVWNFWYKLNENVGNRLNTKFSAHIRKKLFASAKWTDLHSQRSATQQKISEKRLNIGHQMEHSVRLGILCIGKSVHCACAMRICIQLTCFLFSGHAH